MRGCAQTFVRAGARVFEIGQEWDNLALLPGRGGDEPSQYNATIYAHLLAELRGMAAAVRKAAGEEFAGEGGSAVQIGVNTGGWIHYAFLQMLVKDKLDFDIVAYHWYSDMGDLDKAGGRYGPSRAKPAVRAGRGRGVGGRACGLRTGPCRQPG